MSPTNESPSLVKPLDLGSYRLMHKDSFAHRNIKTYIVAIHVAGSHACLAAEEEIEKLAYSLRDEPHVVCASLDALESREHFSFCTGVLHVKSYPTILLYPEGSPGLLRYTGDEVTARGLIDAINGSFRATGNSRRVFLEEESTGGNRSTSTRSIDGERRMSQEVSARLKEDTGSYWSAGKTFFWAFIVMFAISSYVWDRWLGEWFSMWQLADRQKKRRLGQDFDEATTEQDLLSISYLDANRAISEAQEGKK